MKIVLRPDAVPLKVTCPRPIPLAMRDQTKELLDGLEGRGVIERVTTPTDWVHPLTVVRKPTGALRLCVDLRQLNKFVDRPAPPYSPAARSHSRSPPQARPLLLDF